LCRWFDSAPGHHLKLKKPLRSRWGFCFWGLVTGGLVLSKLLTGWQRPFERTKPQTSDYGTVGVESAILKDYL
jgi:hypothetical protein